MGDLIKAAKEISDELLNCNQKIMADDYLKSLEEKQYVDLLLLREKINENKDKTLDWILSILCENCNKNRYPDGSGGF